MDTDMELTKRLYSTHRFGTFNYGRRRVFHNPAALAFIAGLPHDAMIFDIGCGTGFWMDIMSQFVPTKENIRGVDLVSENVRLLKDKGYMVATGDVLALPIADGVSDFTFCNGVIHCTHDPLGAFRELVRITTPGGSIFISVYNKKNPYFYLVHRAMFPLRYLYWRGYERVLDVFYPFAKMVFQPLALLWIGSLLDERTAKTMFFDQVMTPHSHLFTQTMLREYALLCNCEIIRFQYVMGYMMLTAVFKVKQ